MSQTSSIIIRDAVIQDLPGVYRLVKQLAEYEKEPHAVLTTIEDYEESFGDLFEAIVAIQSKEVVGIAIYNYTWSTWKGKMLWLEDFVVAQQHRNKGIGQLLFSRLIEIAKGSNCALMKWQVLDWNTPALQFYNKYDAAIDKGWWNGTIVF